MAKGLQAKAAMEASYVTALAALGGAAIGGLNGFATSWITQRIQMKEEQRSSNKSQRQKLYKTFIDEASKVYGHALINEKPEFSGLINLHALVSKMRVYSSPVVVESATGVVRVISDTYGQPNRSTSEIETMIHNDQIDVLRSFSEACRWELEMKFLS